LGLLLLIYIYFVIIFFANNIYVKTWLHLWEKFLLFIHIYALRKSNASWINHSLLKKSSLDILWVCMHNAILNKWTTNQLPYQIWWNTFKVLGFCQLNAPSHPNSSSSLFKQPSPSCTHWHYVIEHNLYLVDIFVKILVFIFEWFETFIKKCGTTFGDLNKKCMLTNKLQSLHQGSCLVVMYTFKFKQLACDISWMKLHS